eukprot:m.33791 g.33791  ORF g.33791 m.33791 type:complete len:341 (+) comp14255_c1_seq4:25-1047(+)
MRCLRWAGYIDGIDLNLGCPQRSAMRGGFGCFLMEHPETVCAMIRAAKKATHLPISAKIRVFADDVGTHTVQGRVACVRTGSGAFATPCGHAVGPSTGCRSCAVECDLGASTHGQTHARRAHAAPCPDECMAGRTAGFARQLVNAGIWMLAVHGRTRTQRHHEGQVHFDVIQRICRAVPSIPVIANGGITSRTQAEAVLRNTGCAAVMAASRLLSNVSLFDPSTVPDATTTSDDDGLASMSAKIANARVYLHAARIFPPPGPRFLRDHVAVNFGQDLRWRHPDLYNLLVRNTRVTRWEQFWAIVDVLASRETPDVVPTLPTLRQIKDMAVDATHNDVAVA